MTLNQFEALSVEEQQTALLGAVLLADREVGRYTVYLFGLDSFYVEVYCHKDDPFLGRYRSFDELDELEPYLEKIEIEW
jgi:hypothetical protein